MRGNASGWPDRAKRELVAARVETCFYASGWRDIRISRSKASDLIHEVKIAPWQAVLGAEIEVPTLEGKVRLKIPPGTQGGQKFRLREHGLPTASGKRGDLYVVVQINIPKKITERERELWRELAKLHGDYRI